MFLYDMFYPEYKSITDFSVFDKFMLKKTEEVPLKEVPIPLKEVPLKEVPIPLKEVPIPLKEVPLKEIPLIKKEVPLKKEKTIYQRFETECIYAKNVQDGLFWSMYIAQYGYTEYHRNKYNFGKIEVQEKEKIAEYLHKNGSSTKTNYKLTRGFCCEIESDLITTPKMTFSGLIGMAAYYHCDIMVVDIQKNIYYLFSGTDADDSKKETYILYKNPLFNNKYSNKSNEYFIDVDHKIYSLLEIKEMFFKIENYQKPMKSISNYKKIELECIAKKTVFSNSNSEDSDIKDKTQLYEKILLYLI